MSTISAGTTSTTALVNTGDTTGNLVFQTNGTTTAMTIDASQNVGIGTSSPLQRFNAVNTSITGGAPASSGSAADPNAVARFQVGAVAVDLGAYVSGTVWLQPRLASDYSSNFSMALQPNGGNVGIGTSSPAYKFDVQGGRSVLSANSEAFALGLRYNTSTNGVWLGSPSANAFQISSFGGGAYLNIDSSGNLLVGTTSASAKITLKSASNAFSQGLGLVSSSSTNWWSLITDGSTNRLYFGYNGSSLSYIDQTTGMFIAVSDARVKKNIVDIGYGLDTVMQLRPVKYNMVNDNDTQKKRLGLIAQEVKGVIDEAVDNTVGIGGMLGLDKSVLVPVLIKAIQELKAQNDDLRARVAALEGK